MLIMDIGNITFAAVGVDLARSKSTDCDRDFLRHLIINSIRGKFKKLSNEEEDVVLAVDSPHSWRKDFFPNYKANRQITRKASAINWMSIFESFNIILEEIRENLPYKFIKVPKLEADDIIGILAYNFDKVRKYEGEKCVIVSNDKDFCQLDTLPYVKRYRPISENFVKEPYPQDYLLEQIIRGDRVDGIPNIKSSADAIINGTRQSSITTKFIKECMDSKLSNLNDIERRRYEDNKVLIDLKEIPQEFVEPVLEQFNYSNGKTKTDLFQYFASHGLKSLAGNLNDF